MTKADFDKFVARQKAQAAAGGADAEAIRKEWLDQVGGLYRRVESYLREYIARGDIQVHYKPLEINEESLGSYETSTMTLMIGSEAVELVPIGAVIIGARGRVDLVGSRGRRARFLLVSKESQGLTIKITTREGSGERGGLEEEPAEAELAWKLATPPPSVRFIELTPETLMDAIREVAGG